jgi:excisionase family DNA binding protein
MNPQSLLTAKEVCAWLRVSRMTLHRMVKRGAIPVVRVGRLLRFRPEAIERYLRKAEV